MTKKVAKAGGGRTARNPSPVLRDFSALVDAIRGVHEHCAAQATRAVNVDLTVRNWLIGAHVHNYELYGRYRAEYGQGLFTKLAQRLDALGVPNCNRSHLYRY